MGTTDFGFLNYTLRKFPDGSWQIRQDGETVTTMPQNTGIKKVKAKVREMISKTPMNITATEIQERCDKIFAPKLAPLPSATCAPQWKHQYYIDPPCGLVCPKQQGITPMATNTTMSGVSINTTSPPTDASKMRDYLFSRLDGVIGLYEWQRPIYSKLRKQFNLDAPKIPLTSQEIIDAFKNGKVTIDQAKVDKQTKYFANQTKDEDYDDDCDFEPDINNRYFGITFTDLPVADHKGYTAATEAYDKAILATKDAIAILDPTDGLAALKALENWTPRPTLSPADHSGGMTT